MKPFQKYFYESSKLYEFRIKIANYDVTKPEVIDCIKNAIDAYQLETISNPKRLPIQEHRSFSKLGPCECYIIDIAVKYPTITEQIRQLIINRAGVNADCVCVYTKDQQEQEDAINERLDSQEPVLTDPKLKDDPSSQDLVGQGRVASLIKELETRKYETAGKATPAGKTTANDVIGTISPIAGAKKLRDLGKKVGK